MVQIQVQWSTAKLTLSCQLKRNKQARGDESCRSIPSRRHTAARLSLPVHFRSHPSPFPRPAPRPRPKGTQLQPPFVPSRVQHSSLESLLPSPPASSFQPLHLFASRRVASHPPNITSPHLAPVPYTTSSGTLPPGQRFTGPASYSAPCVTRQQLLRSPRSFPVRRESVRIIIALSFQNLSSRERNHGPAVSPRRTSNHWWWSVQSKRPAPTTRIPRRHLRCAALQSPARARPTSTPTHIRTSERTVYLTPNTASS